MATENIPSDRQNHIVLQWMQRLLVLWLSCSGPIGNPPVLGAESWYSGKKFDWALDQPVIATWQNSQFRLALNALSEQRRVPVLLDRRLDPSRRFSFETQGESLREIWPQLAKIVDGKVSNTGQTIYLGPAAAAGKLRTLIALRQQDLQSLDFKQLPAGLRQLATQKHPLRWQELSTPQEILQSLADRWSCELNGLPRIPHDLWAAADLPPLPCAEALTLVLIQFDLTFKPRIMDRKFVIDIVPIPENLVLERKWTLPRAKAQAIAQTIQSELPELTTEASSEQLVARGTHEQIIELEQMIQSLIMGSTARSKKPSPAPLAKRKLTFQAQDAPLSAILNRLTDTGIEFEYDKAEFKAEGIDIDQLIAIDVKDVSPDELFQQLFNPLGIEYHVEGLRVRLSVTKK